MFEEREFHTPEYQHWYRLITPYLPPNCQFTGTQSIPPGYICKPPTPEDEATQAKIQEERADLLEYFGRNTICKDLHRRASLRSIYGDFEYPIARIQASTLLNGFDHAINEHFDKHMHHFTLCNWRKKRIKLFCPSIVWWTVTSMMKHPLRTKP